MGMMFLDFDNAFDSVWNDNLSRKLDSFCSKPNISVLIHFYLVGGINAFSPSQIVDGNAMEISCTVFRTQD